MKILLLLFILNNTFVFCQNTRNDSLLYNNLWNSISWNINIKNNLNYLVYSSGNEYIKYRTNEIGMPYEAITYFFDTSKIAMKTILFTDPNKSALINTNEWQFTENTFYVSGKLRSIENHFLANKSRLFFNDLGELFYSEIIVENDTISGVFMTSLDESYNIIFSVYEQGKVIALFKTDNNYNLLSNQCQNSRKKIKKWVMILQKINAKPISGI